MRHRTWIAVAALTAGVGAALAWNNTTGEGDSFTTDFALERCARLVHFGGNDYFSLRPGTTLWLEGDDDGEFVELEIKVLPRVRVIEFEYNGETIEAMCRVIREREWADGELIEVSFNYFARCTRTQNIYYFGEDVCHYEDGECVSHEGAWIAGENGAQPGLIMPSVFLLGARYFQEIAEEDEALDRAEHVEMGLEVETPAGVFEDCVMILETTPLDPKEESVKIYAPGIGIIYDDGLILVDYDV